MVDVEQLTGFGGRKVGAVRPEELQRVPLGLVMAGADRDTAGCVITTDCVLNDRRGNDTQIDHFMPTGEQPGEHAFANHDAACAWIAAHQHGPAGFKKRSKRAREIEHMLGSKTSAHDATKPHVRDPERLLRGHYLTRTIRPNASGTW